MRRLFLILIAASLSAQTGVISVRHRAAAPSISVVQTCMAAVWSSTASCATTTNFASGQHIWVFAFSPGTLSTTLSTSGAGCPASFSVITSATGYLWEVGTANAGSCTITVALASGADTQINSAWFATSGDTGTADGTGNLLTAVCSGTPCSGAFYSTSHDGDVVLGAMLVGTSDASIAVSSPFSSASPFRISGSYGDNVAGGVVGTSQASHGSIQLGWTTGLEWTSWTSTVLGIY
jgi:hypothetical protein